MDLPPIGIPYANPLSIGCEIGRVWIVIGLTMDNDLADGNGIVLWDRVWIVGLVYDWQIGERLAEWRGLAMWIGPGVVSD